MEETGRLADDRIEAAVAAVRRFVDLARQAGAGRVVAVATEATRAAANGPEFLDRVRRETGVEVRAIDGDEEARLTFRGLAATADLSGPTLVADVGGGSTELIAARDGAPLAWQSLPLGSGRLTDRRVRADPPTAAELASCKAAAGEILRAESALGLEVADVSSRLIVVGGTGEYLQRLAQREPADRSEVERVLTALTQMSAGDLATWLGIAESRARVLPAGIAIVAAVADTFGATRIEMARSGVRLGLLLDVLRPNPAAAAGPRERDVDG
jgi:exopolyphosphatase/guanosine-5'-triphosphate,3'-diphosphate pyrophosphatase